MSNKESRIRGMAQRALALFMAIVLATTLTPSLALASEQAASDSDAKTEQAAPASNETPGGSANEQGNAASDNNNEGQASGSSAAENSRSDTTGSNGAESSSTSADDEGESQANTVSATLKISVYGTALVSHTFDIKKGKTVEDLLNLAKEQGYIDAYSVLSYDDDKSHFICALTIQGKEFDQSKIENAYWMSTISDDPDKWDIGIEHDIVDCDGYTYSLNLAKCPDDGSKYDDGTGDYPISPNTPNPDTAREDDTTSYVKGDGNNSTITSAPTSSENAALAWKKTYGSGCYSEVLSISDSVYLASSLYNADYSRQTAVLHRFNLDGEETASLQLFGTIDTTCRMVYTNGIIIIPLSDGRLQGVSSSQLKTMWVSNIIATGDMNMSTVTASDGLVFTGTTSNWSATSGTFFGINALTGECMWANKNSEAGYYWAGACKVGNVLVFGDNAGALKAVDPATGKIVSSLKLSSAIRSTVITNSMGTKAYVVTNDGTLHEIGVGLDGSLTEAREVNFDANGSGAGAPTLFEGNIYVGGGNYYSKGSFVVIDAASMQIKSSVELPFYSQSAPLVAKAADGKTYAYFTCNGAETNEKGKAIGGGGAWVYCLETNTAAKLFDATGDMANWCTKSITMGANGTLYWTNDSGTLFALASASSSNDEDEGDQGKEDGSNNESNDGSNSGKPGNDSNSSSKEASSISLSSKTADSTSVVAKTPSTVSKVSEEQTSNEAGNEVGLGASASASSAKNTSSDGNSDNGSQQVPWLPIAGIVVGCVGLVGVGTYLLRRRDL